MCVEVVELGRDARGGLQQLLSRPVGHELRVAVVEGNAAKDGQEHDEGGSVLNVLLLLLRELLQRDEIAKLGNELVSSAA